MERVRDTQMSKAKPDVSHIILMTGLRVVYGGKYHYKLQKNKIQ